MCSEELTFPVMTRKQAKAAGEKSFTTRQPCKECGSQRRFFTTSSVLCYDCCGAHGTPLTVGAVNAEAKKHNDYVRAMVAKKSNFAVVVSKGMKTT